MPDKPSNRETTQADQASFEMRPCPKCGLLLDRTVAVCPRDGTALIKPIEQDSNFLNKYEFLGTIGSGGMGVIYKARQVVMDKVVAIKMLHQHLVSPEAFRRFQLEGHAAGMLSHPNIIAIYDLGITDSDQPYMVMEFVDGITLSQLIASGQTLTVARFAKIFLQVCDGLAHAHGRNVLHRDIKPSNIMLVRAKDGTEQVRIMDFGIAKIVDDTVFGGQKLTKTGDAIGSPLYMSPEQGKGGAVDGRSDLYSLGCVMYEVLSGKPPFMGSTTMETLLKHFNERPVPLTRVKTHRIEPEQDAMVMKLLQKDPALRYQSMSELMNDLQLLLAASGRGIGRFNLPIEQHRRAMRMVKLSAVLLVVALVVAIWGQDVLRAGRDMYKSYSTRNSRDRRIASQLISDGKQMNLSEIILESKVNDDDLKQIVAPKVEKLNVSNSDVTDAGCGSLDCPNVTELQLDNTKVSELKFLSKFPLIQDLSLKSTHLEKNALKNVGELANLEQLDLQNADFDPATLAYLSGLGKISMLNLRDDPQVTPKYAHELEIKLGEKNFRNEKDQTTEIIRDSGYPVAPGTIKIYISSGQHFVESGNFALSRHDEKSLHNANRLYEAAERDFLDQKKFSDYAEAVRLHANCLLLLHDFAGAEGLYRNAIKVVTALSPGNIGLPVLYAGEGAAMDAQNDPDACTVREKAAAIFKAQHSSSESAVNNMMALGQEYISLGQSDNAVQRLIAALEMAKQNQNPELIAKASVALGDAWTAAAQFDKAISYYERATDVYAGTKSASGNDDNVDCELKVADGYHHLSQDPKAEAYVVHLLNDKSLPPRARDKLLHKMIELLEGQNKQTEANDYIKQLSSK
ncbi:MAG TPA: protein kinase [Planktothrix sp.]|jgi:serine/threonine protein kinase